MPPQLQDLAIQIGQLRDQLNNIATGGNQGYALRKLSDTDQDYGWQQDASTDIITGTGNPNTGKYRGFKGQLYIDVSTPALWQNSDGHTTWAAIGSAPSSAVFSYPGSLTAAVESPPFYPQSSYTFTEIRVSLLANASVDHVVRLLKNGSTVADYTLTAGNKTMTAAISVAVTATDYLTMKTITVADSNLSVELTI